MRCTRLAAYTGRKKIAKNRHLGTIAQICRAVSSQLRHVSTIGKKLVKQQYLLYMSSQYGELRPTGYILKAVRCPYVTYVRNAGRGQLSSE